MVPAVRPLRQLVLSPTAFFEDQPPEETLVIAVGIVILLAISVTAAIVLVGSMLAGAIDATVTMDNPDRPPEPICAQHADDPDSMFGENCDEPETIERDASELVQEAVHDYLWLGLVGPFLMWIIGAIVIFGVGRLVGGSPSVLGTLSLAGWAALPEFFRLAVGLAVLRYVLGNMTITDPEQAASALETAMAPIEPVLFVASLLTLIWQWSLLTGGLSQDADLRWETAAIAVGIPLGLLFVFGTL